MYVVCGLCHPQICYLDNSLSFWGIPHHIVKTDHYHCISLTICSTMMFHVIGDDFDRGMEGKDNFGDFKIGSLPTLLYIPDFITDSEQTALLNNVAFPSLSFMYKNYLPHPLQCVCFPSPSPFLHHRFMELLFQSGNLLEIEGYRIGVCLHLCWLFCSL